MELILLVCLLTSPNNCKTVHLPITIENGQPMMCMMQSQAIMTKWVNENPKYMVKSFKCSS